MSRIEGDGPRLSSSHGPFQDDRLRLRFSSSVQRQCFLVVAVWMMAARNNQRRSRGATPLWRVWARLGMHESHMGQGSTQPHGLGRGFKDGSTTRFVTSPRLSPRTQPFNSLKTPASLRYGRYPAEAESLRRKSHDPSLFSFLDLNFPPQYCHQKQKFGYVHSPPISTSTD